MPHLERPVEQTVGIHVDLSHEAATPPGMRVTARVTLAEVEGRRLLFEVVVRDEADLICRGCHGRFVVNAEKFNAALEKKWGRV